MVDQAPEYFRREASPIGLQIRLKGERYNRQCRAEKKTKRHQTACPYAQLAQSGGDQDQVRRCNEDGVPRRSEHGIFYP